MAKWYVKLIFRTGGEVRCSYPVLRDYSYPDSRRAFFSCSDGELNEIYAAARRTLRLCTLDIFMDCPQRERGGWLCDSYFSGKGAWMMFGDLGVERDFIENFMLTDPEEKWKGFFPEVYPGIKQKPEDVGISNWSFWLLLELADFAKRSGDREFVERCRSRVERFVEGLLSLRGESGLLENLPEAFVDWSLSNTEYALKPVSIPNNCLAVRALEEMAGLYHMPEWEKAGGEMRRILQDIGTGSPFGGAGDGAVLENGALRRTHLRTESGIALELWSGFYGEDADYVGKFMDSMGPAPRYRQDPNIGLANLFIGLMIRFDVLAGAGEADALVKEWKSLYLPQLHMGSGTLFENSHEFSGCHGFNGAVGALMTNVVLGLGEPNQESRTVAVRPHLCGLDWAKGAACTGEGMIYMGWSADYRLHILDITLQLPPGWTAQYDFPFACSGWRILVNGKCARNEDFLSPQSTRNFNGGIEDFGGNNSTGRICCSSNRIS